MIVEADFKYDRMDFDVVTKMKLRASPAELTRIVLEAKLVHQWCPCVFLKAEVIEAGQPADGLGMEMRLHTKGWLPFSFFFYAKIIETVRDRSMIVSLCGDFEGRGLCRIEPIGDDLCSATLRWQVNVNQPYLRPFLWILKPVGKLNHSWAVRQIYSHLQREVDRRRAVEGLVQPKPATFPHNIESFRRSWRSIDRNYPIVDPVAKSSVPDNTRF